LKRVAEFDKKPADRFAFLAKQYIVATTPGFFETLFFVTADSPGQKPHSEKEKWIHHQFSIP
jgi:hypothetical protein